MFRLFLLVPEGRGSAHRDGKNLSCLLIPDPRAPQPRPSSPSPLSVIFTKPHLFWLLKHSREKTRTLRRLAVVGLQQEWPLSYMGTVRKSGPDAFGAKTHLPK